MATDHVFLLVPWSQILWLAVGDGQEKSRPCQGERSKVSPTHSNATELITGINLCDYSLLHVQGGAWERGFTAARVGGGGGAWEQG